jgi:DNA modification methylase
MADLPDACVDLVITDPPYGVANDTVIMRNNGTVWHSHDFGWWDYFKDDSEFIAFTDSWVKEAARLLRPCGSFYSFFPKEKIYILVQQKLRWEVSEPEVIPEIPRKKAKGDYYE